MSETLPNEENAIWVDTTDIIFPGFIDLHNHPMYAMFEPWDAKQRFNNRYEWRSLDRYKQEISTPARKIQDDPQGFCDIAEFAEVQALTGGTTTFSDVPPQIIRYNFSCVLISTRGEEVGDRLRLLPYARARKSPKNFLVSAEI